MNKEELIQIHTLMAMMKEFLEKRGKGEFSKYKALNISPIHVHKNKYAHKDAIFILGEEIISAIDNSNNIVINQISEDKIVNKISEDKIINQIDDMIDDMKNVQIPINEILTVNDKVVEHVNYGVNSRGKNG